MIDRYDRDYLNGHQGICMAYPFEHYLVERTTGYNCEEVIAKINQFQALIESNGFFAVTLYDVLMDALGVVLSDSQKWDMHEGKLPTYFYGSDYFALVSDTLDNMLDGCSDDEDLAEYEGIDRSDIETIATLAHQLCNVFALGFAIFLEDGERNLLRNMLMESRDVFDVETSSLFVDINTDAIIFKTLIPVKLDHEYEPEEHSYYNRIRDNVSRALQPTDKRRPNNRIGVRTYYSNSPKTT